MTATRKLLYVLNALAVLQLWSCSSDEVVSTSGQPESEVQMTFDVLAEQATTRGDVISSTESFTQVGRKFKLWCWMTDGTGTYPMTSDFNSTPLTAVDVTYTAATYKVPAGWYADQTFYWPRPKYRADFYAIYPANTVTSFTDTPKTIAYTPESPYDGNTDLMYATYSDQRAERDNSEKSRTVFLKFNHAMAQIMFFGKLSAEFKTLGYNVEVKKIEIRNMNGAGVFTLKSAFEDLGTDYQIANITDNSENKEKRIGGASAMSFTPYTSTLTTYTPAMNITGNAGDPDHLLLDNDETAISLTSPTDILMVLPQNLPAWDNSTETTGTTSPATSGGYLAIDLRIVDISGGADSPVYPLKSNGDYVTVYVPFGSTSDGRVTASATTSSPWVGGKLYKYNLIFGVGLSAGGKSIIQPLVIEAAIAPWQEATPVTGTIQRRQE
jgi:hypothetical protein